MTKTRKKKRTSQTDLAEALGVSVSTVSRALAGHVGTDTAFRSKVFAMAQKMDYPIKQSQDFQSFDCVYIFSSVDWFRDARATAYQALLDGICSEAEQFSGRIETVITQTRRPLPDGIREKLGPKTGCIFLGITPAEETLNDLVANDIPTVTANSIDEDLRVDAVMPANFAGGANIARRLIGQNHRRFLCLNGQNRGTLQRRFAGFRQFVENHSHPGGAEIVSVFQQEEENSKRDAIRFAKWIKEHRSQATALFCFSDFAAMWAMEKMKAEGINVPNEMSVVGFDDMPFAALSEPSLTTYRINWNDVGRECVQNLHKRMSVPDSAVRVVQIGGVFIERSSVIHCDT